jgi:hypothetical protein
MMLVLVTEVLPKCANEGLWFLLLEIFCLLLHKETPAGLVNPTERFEQVLKKKGVLSALLDAGSIFFHDH